MRSFVYFVLFLVLALSWVPMGWSSLAADVSGAVKNDDGQYFIEHEGDQWQIVEDKGSARVYYYSATKQKSQWEDPRAPAAPSPVVDDDIPEYFPEAEEHTSSIVAITVVPAVLLVAAIAGRIWYLNTYYPELLFPLKERKQRRQKSAKSKPQKQRGKMSQDGKGGRSANS